ncbi:hypothetical protein ACIPWY_03980 [Streptomyces sp. NPDC090032]|uniref:hypothetical protein n=1 Tax=Streptomyces sp. NPDC090032 TaxID=3365925 RepID=UPI0038296EE7
MIAESQLQAKRPVSASLAAPSSLASSPAGRAGGHVGEGAAVVQTWPGGPVQ